MQSALAEYRDHSCRCAHRIPESLSAFWRIVSLTAAKTRRMFDVSVACVKLFELVRKGSEKNEMRDVLRI